MKINKNKIKWLMVLVPLIMLWAVFIVAHLLEMKANSWWAMPYILTSMVIVVLSTAVTIITVDKHYY